LARGWLRAKSVFPLTHFVTDFTLDFDANPELARGQALLMGFLSRPYTANIGWVRLLYRW